MNNWHGKWIMIVAIIHTALAVVSFGGQYQEIVAEGVINTITTASSGLAVWFFLFGVLLFIAGQLILTVEKNNKQVPKSIGISLLFLAVLGSALMPVSGFWLVLPPAISLILGNKLYAKPTKT